MNLSQDKRTVPQETKSVSTSRVLCLSTAKSKEKHNRPIDERRENRVDNRDVLLADTRGNSHDERLAPRGPLHSRRGRAEIPGKIKTCGFGGRASGKTGTEGKERKLGSRLRKTVASQQFVDTSTKPSIYLYFSLSLSLFLLHRIHARFVCLRSPFSLVERRVLFVSVRRGFVLHCQRSQESSISISSPEGIVPKRI